MQIHVVQRGDTLWRISQRYGSTASQIALVNQLEDPNVLVVGQSLVVPETNREYIVQPGDNLWAIAQRYGTRIQALVETKSSNPAMIFIGQMLIMPFVSHSVQPGETLWMIAQRYGTSVEAIIQANQIANPSLIFPWQVLRIPANARPVTEVNAYTTRTNEEGRQEVLSLGMHFTYLTPFTYSIWQDGGISEMNEVPILNAARANRVAPLLVLTNFVGGKFNSDLAATVLRSPELQETLFRTS